MQQAPSQTDGQQYEEVNPLLLCDTGKRAVQDIFYVSRQLFSILKETELPEDGSQGKRNKARTILQKIRLQFRWVKLLYNKCNEEIHVQGLEYIHVESLIPLRGEADHTYNQVKNSETYKKLHKEYEELQQQVLLKNIQMKEVVSHLRRAVCEINAMLAMRRS